MTQSLSATQSPVRRDLRLQADLFEQVLSCQATDAHGIVRASLWRDPIRALQSGDLSASQSLVRGVSAEDLYAYEDAGMATGAYLAAESIRFRVTQDLDAKARADRAFDGIRHIHNLGAAQRPGHPARPGFFPKPYGGRASAHLSRDQYLFVMTGLAEYHTIAQPAQQLLIREMIGNMARYWIDIDYRTSYFSLPAASHLDDYMGSLFLGIMGPAAKRTHDARLEAEYERLCGARRLAERMPETLTAQFRRGVTYDGAMFFRQPENAMMMKAMAVDRLWDADPDRRDLWRHSLRTFWDEDLLVPLDAQSGLNYFILGYDAATGRTYLTEPGVIEALSNPLDLPLLTWGGKRQHAGSTQTAFAAAIIADRCALPEAGRIAESVLNKLSLSGFRGLTVPDDRHIPPGHEFELNLLNSAYLAYWLWTYWLMRDRSLIP